MKWYQCYTYDSSPYCCDPPLNSGIYAIFLFNSIKRNKKLIYIGSSKNLKQRLNRLSHPVISRKNKFPYLTIVFALECTDYLKKEKRYIKRLKPSLNKMFLNKKRIKRFGQLLKQNG